MHYVGETSNFKNRIPEHKFNLIRDQASNKKFQADFNQDSNCFELILFASGAELEDNYFRKALEKALQTELRLHNLCYNSGLCETIHPRQTGKTPSTPGVYILYCKPIEGVYVGETEQRSGLNGRRKRWFQKLRNGTAQSAVLADFERYGEDQFEFIVVESGPEWQEKNKRLDRQKELIQQQRAKGGICYNFFDDDRNIAPRCDLNNKNTIINNQSEAYKKFMSALNTGRVNPNRTGVKLGDLTFFSIAEAAEFFDCSRRVIRVKINKLNTVNRRATPEEIALETERRKALNIEKPVNTQPITKRTSGKKEPVLIYGIEYDSLSAAARALNISVQAINKKIKNKSPGCKKLNN
uniref:Putative GIY-YIG endonuclease n=1 Tax=Chloromonas augustae TaxID=87091 RepID=U5I320_9CHLO|nr:putative GIY-YIG endonuclease [Chloromonas augustae]